MFKRAQARTVSARDYSAGGRTTIHGGSVAVSAAALLTVAGAIMLAASTPPTHELSRQAEDESLQSACARWEASALEAMSSRVTTGKVGIEVYAQSAARLLTEARRYCDLGRGERAISYYDRIVVASKPRA